MIRIRLGRRAGGGLSVAACAALAAVYGVAYFGSAERVTFTVRDKSEDLHRDGGGDDELRLLVATDGGEVFEVDGSWTFLAFDRRERFRALEVGRTYEAVVAGWRAPMLSWRRNIIKVLSEG
jgi:hypothetical protein